MHYRRIPAWNYWYYYSHIKSHFNQFHFVKSGTASPSVPVTVQIAASVSAAGRGRAKRENKCGVTVLQPKSRDVASPACATSQLTTVSCQCVAGS